MRLPHLSVLFFFTACARPADAPSTETPVEPDVSRTFVATELGYRARLPNVRVDATFQGNRARLQDDSGGEITLTMLGAGRDQGFVPFSAPITREAPDRLVQVSGELSSWWTSRADGFAQGFVLQTPPAGEGALQIVLQAEGAEVTAWFDGQGADLVADDGSRWTYRGIMAWDADGVLLPAFIEGEAEIVRLVVDDAEARWPVTIDPVFTTAANTLTGTSGAGLGQAVAGGDVNGDGYDDLVVSAYRLSTRGAVYVYHGSATGIGTLPNVTLYPATSGYDGQFGLDLKLGDFDGDGFDDVVINEPEYNNGTIYVFEGSASGVSSTASVVFSGTGLRERKGYALGVGDWNADGYDDLVASSLYGNNNYGAAYVHYGSRFGLDTNAALTLTGTSGEYYAYHADEAGDVNNDGYDDFIIGHYAGASYYGRAYIFAGSASGISPTPLTTLTGPQIDLFFGRAVAGLGDVNGDGYDDVGVGATSLDLPYGDSGGVYVYHGAAAGPSTTPSATLYGVGYGDRFGWAIDAAGDTNGDGFGDVIVGAIQANGATYAAGAAHVIPGSAAGLVFGDRATVYAGTSPYEEYGSEVGGVGDLDGDGLDDVAVGHTKRSANNGAAYVYLGTDGVIDDDGDGYFTSGGSSDCDDTNPSIHPNASETCDGVDQDCDEQIDDGVTTTYYADSDGDGYGDATNTLAACSLPSGYVTNNTDCNDTSALARPGGAEVVASEIDEDCNGQETCFADVDHDGFGSSGGSATVVSSDTDCDDLGESTSTTDLNDNDDTIYPGATELIGDGIDQDCDGGDQCYQDLDGDGHGSPTTITSADLDCADPGESALGDDCDDAAPTVYGGAAEVVADGVDQDCDSTERCYVDADGDDYGSSTTQGSIDLDCGDAAEAAVAGDCNDLALTIHPGGVELNGNGVDEDCDGGDSCYADDDGDGYGSTRERVSGDLDCDDAGESAVLSDCDDLAASTWPGAAELVADGVDQDCDDGDLCHADQDGDGFGDPTTTISSVDLDCQDSGESDDADDCDDAADDVFPGATEILLNGRDEDCDAGDLCVLDADGDGFGGDGSTLSADLDCADPNESTVTTDCDDTASTTFPGATEQVGDNVDQDCDGVELCYLDADGDSHGGGTSVVSADSDCLDLNEAVSATDCDDTSASISPGVSEVIADGVDQDCDLVDDCWTDGDGDGFGSGVVMTGTTLGCDGAGESTTSDDCEDAAVASYPGAPELTADGVDQDCDGYDHCYLDADGDGEGSSTPVAGFTLDCSGPAESPVSSDCDDSSAARNSGAIELVADNIDSDCDGEEVCYIDGDADGYGGEGTTRSADLSCASVGLAEVSGDCNDERSDVSPAVSETASDGVDSDCDGAELCQLDADADGYGVASQVSSETLTCDTPGLSTRDDDCADDNDTIHPGATELIADGLDQDCDGGETCYADTDGDSFGGADPTRSANLSCEDAGEATANADCDDTVVSSFPGATETCNGADDNCDGNDDEGLECEPKPEDPAACGCSSSPSGGLAVWMLLGLGLVRRRR